MGHSFPLPADRTIMDASPPPPARRSLLHRLYDWTLHWAAHKRARVALFGVSFVESSVFPIPPDILLIPMVLADRRNAFWIATICTIASVLGGAAGYAIGLLLFDSVGQAVLDFYGYAAKFTEFSQLYNEWGWMIVAGAGFTPFPYKVITIASGVTQMDFAVFMIASVLSRGARFYLVAAMLWYFGPPIQRVIEKHLGLLTILFFVLLVGGFVALKYLL